ncbi:hypothetical protein VTI74DRAFT_7663 [Chaetomium olivicolor]
MKHAASLILAAGLAAAQSTTIANIFLPMVDAQMIVASVVSAGPTATAYALRCPAGADPNECGLGDESITVFCGPSTMTYAFSMGDNAAYADCKLDPVKKVADCLGSMVEGTKTKVESEVITDYTSFILPVTVTAGIEKLSAGAAATTGGAATTVDKPTATDGPTGVTNTLSTSVVPTSSDGASASASTSTSTSASASASASTSTSTGGMPRITQNAVIMGAAAVAGGAMLI